MATILVFGISLFTSFSLVLLKAFEIKFGRKNFILRSISALDSGSSSLIGSLKFRTLQFIQTVRYIVIVRIREMVNEYILGLQERIAKEYHIQQETLMGRRNLSSKGSVSFYLKRITENKSTPGIGKIEESL